MFSSSGSLNHFLCKIGPRPQPQAGKGSATLSMAYAAAVFAESCLKAMAGQSGLRRSPRLMLYRSTWDQHRPLPTRQQTGTMLDS